MEIASPISIFSRNGPLDAVRYQGSVYVADGGGSSPVLKLVSDPHTNRPSMVPLHGANQGFALLTFKDRSGKTPDQLLVATSEAVMRVVGDQLLPTLTSVHDLDRSAYLAIQSRKTPDRVFIGFGDGVGSMRWDGGKWIDEGRLPNTVYVSHTLAEDSDGDLWVGGGKGHLLRIKVAPSGMRDSTVEAVSSNYSIPAGNGGVSYALGDLYAGLSNEQNIYRWDRTTHKFIVDNRLQLHLDVPKASPQIYETPDGSVWTVMQSSDAHRIARVTRNPDGSFHLDEDTYKPLTHYKDLPSFVDTDGSVWSTGDSLLRFDPGLRTTVSEQLPALVRQVNAGMGLVYGGTELRDGSELRLAPGSSSVLFRFAAPIYSDSVDADYQYLLEGADKDWSGWGKQKEANYSGLGPGEYRFRVHARSADGRISPEGMYSFVILAPWYRTTLAYILYGLLLVVLALACWRYISMHEREKARRKDRSS